MNEETLEQMWDRVSKEKNEARETRIRENYNLKTELLVFINEFFSQDESFYKKCCRN